MLNNPAPVTGYAWRALPINISRRWWRMMRRRHRWPETSSSPKTPSSCRLPRDSGSQLRAWAISSFAFAICRKDRWRGRIGRLWLARRRSARRPWLDYSHVVCRRLRLLILTVISQVASSYDTLLEDIFANSRRIRLIRIFAITGDASQPGVGIPVGESDRSLRRRQHFETRILPAQLPIKSHGANRIRFNRIGNSTKKEYLWHQLKLA
jgi:hypothetical protein